MLSLYPKLKGGCTKGMSEGMMLAGRQCSALPSPCLLTLDHIQGSSQPRATKMPVTSGEPKTRGSQPFRHPARMPCTAQCIRNSVLHPEARQGGGFQALASHGGSPLCSCTEGWKLFSGAPAGSPGGSGDPAHPGSTVVVTEVHRRVNRWS